MLLLSYPVAIGLTARVERLRFDAESVLRKSCLLIPFWLFTAAHGPCLMTWSTLTSVV